MCVYFVGAGPGDPELLTRKGYRLIAEADCIIYAGSLVNPDIYSHHKASCQLHDSASMTLEEVLAVMRDMVGQGLSVVRLHTGDPALYGAIQEQMDTLSLWDIAYEVVPGISSYSAAAAALQREFTLPGVSQSLILTRLAGRTPVPELEQLELLASHQTSMAIFLSVGMMDKVVAQLSTHYPMDTPIAVIYRASWPDQKIVKGQLSTIANQVKEAGIRKTAQILVGPFLDRQLEEGYDYSKLYDPTFSHEYRKAKDKSQ